MGLAQRAIICGICLDLKKFAAAQAGSFDHHGFVASKSSSYRQRFFFHIFVAKDDLDLITD